MNTSIQLSGEDRKVLLHMVKTASTHERRLRAHLLLLLDDGLPWTTIEKVLFTSSTTINRWRWRYLGGGLEAVIDAPARQSSWFSVFWIHLVFYWVTMKSPQDFGFYRSRWTCGTIVVLLREDHQLNVSRETVRRWLHNKNLVYRRPRPVLGPQDDQRQKKLQKIRSLLRNLPADEVAVFQDEVDINTNPKIGSMWMLRGQQAEVVTPGTNTKRYLAGSQNWRTGEMILTEGKRRNGDLFVAHLDDLRLRMRRYHVIHVICDNAIFHDPERCRQIREYLQKWGHRIKLHFLPAYSPETNPIERVWWHLHEEITRNHRCRNIDQLLDQVFEWFGARSPFEIETSIYEPATAAVGTVG